MPPDTRLAPAPVLHTPHAPPVHPVHRVPRARQSVLAWPAWLRVLAVLPAVALLWLAVAWATAAIAPW